jgi:hypothetical protein
MFRDGEKKAEVVPIGRVVIERHIPQFAVDPP